jgi:hypothetical protein
MYVYSPPSLSIRRAWLFLTLAYHNYCPSPGLTMRCIAYGVMSYYNNILLWLVGMVLPLVQE